MKVAPAARTVLAVLVLLAPGLAQACPTCAAGQDAGLRGVALIGTMIGVPYVVGALAFRALRRIDRRTRADLPPPGSGGRP